MIQPTTPHAENSEPSTDQDAKKQRILYEASTQGFSVVCDAFATETEGQPAGLWLLSLIGPQNGCKAVIANVLKDRAETLQLQPDFSSTDDEYGNDEYEQQLADGRWNLLDADVPKNVVTKKPVPFMSIRDHRSGKWTYRAAKLPLTRAWHILAYSVRAEYDRDDPNFLLVGKPEEDKAAQHHLQFLNRRISLPLDPTWADWLWERGLNNSEITKLHSVGVHAWKCQPNERALRGEITEAISQGEITAPRRNE